MNQRIVTSLFLAFGLLAASTVSADLTIDTVPVGDAGNGPDSRTGSNFGSVGYEYRIGTCSVTNEEYAAFLNAVASVSDPNGLFNPDGAADRAYGGIERSGSAGNYSYEPVPGREQWPVTYVSVRDAARFANWITNGMPVGEQDASTTEDGMYDMSVVGLVRKIDLSQNQAGAALPTENEWYKAAYYQGDGSYSAYVTGATVPTAEPPPGGSNSANFDNANPGGGAYARPTPVGAYIQSSSHYGTFDQDGNTYEWIDGNAEGKQIMRGGAFYLDASFLGAEARGGESGEVEVSYIGFRIVSNGFIGGDVVEIPDPNLLAALLEALGKETGPITTLEMQSLTSLNLANRGITDFTGLEAATNLNILNIIGNQPDDPEALFRILGELNIWCVYSSVQRPSTVEPGSGWVERSFQTESGDTVFLAVNPNELEVLDLSDGIIDLQNPANLEILEELDELGVALENGDDPLPPTPRATVTYSDDDGWTATLDASGSTDVDGSVESYSWTWTDATSGEAEERTGSSFTAEFPSGATTVTLTITDNEGATSTLEKEVVALYIPDRNLRQAIEEELGITDRPLRYEDLQALTSLSLSIYREVRDFEGLQYARELEFFWFEHDFQYSPIRDRGEAYEILDALPEKTVKVLHNFSRPSGSEAPAGEIRLRYSSGTLYTGRVLHIIPEAFPLIEGERVVNVTDWTGFGPNVFAIKVLARDYDFRFVHDSKNFHPVFIRGSDDSKKEGYWDLRVFDIEGELASVEWDFFQISDYEFHESCTEEWPPNGSDEIDWWGNDATIAKTVTDWEVQITPADREEYEALRLTAVDSAGNQTVWEGFLRSPLVYFYRPPFVAKPEEVVVPIPDPAVLGAVRSALGKSAGDSVTNWDLFELEHLDLRGLAITDLTGLENLRNLAVLDLRGTSFLPDPTFINLFYEHTVIYVDEVPVDGFGEEFRFATYQLIDESGETYWMLTGLDLKFDEGINEGGYSYSGFFHFGGSFYEDYDHCADYWDRPFGGQREYGPFNYDLFSLGGANLQLRENRLTLKGLRFNHTYSGPNVDPVSRIVAIIPVGVPGIGVTVSAERSFDLNGRIESYQWNWTDPETGNPQSASGRFAEIPVEGGQVVDVELVVTDDEGGTDRWTESIQMPYRPAAIQIATQLIENPGNDPVIASQGLLGLPQLWQSLIGEREVIYSDYRDFLNAVATQEDPYGLYYYPAEAVNPWIIRETNGGISSYSLRHEAIGDEPANDVPFWNAVRYANWLENGRPVGNPGPATTEDGLFDLSDPAVVQSIGIGDVLYEYHIGYSEVTNAQYAYFLNAVASETDEHGLYDLNMGGIQREETESGFTYKATLGRENHPVNFVSFWSAARFANWMTNGQPKDAPSAETTESGMYDLTDPRAVDRNQVSRLRDFSTGGNGVAIADLDEWFKARYADPDTGQYGADGTTLAEHGQFGSFVHADADFELAVGDWIDRADETERDVRGLGDPGRDDLRENWFAPGFGYEEVGFRLTSLGPIGSQPEVAVEYDGEDIADGSSDPSSANGTDFGEKLVQDGGTSRLFRLVNPGDSPLMVQGVTSSNDQFMVTGLSEAVAPAGFDEFEVVFEPDAEGTVSSVIEIVTNDSDESLFTFVVQGTGVTPEIGLEFEGTDIPGGAEAQPSSENGTDFGEVEVDGADTDSRTFRIVNTGSGELRLEGVSSSDPSFTVSGLDTTAPLAPGTSGEFEVEFRPEAVESVDALISIDTNDLDENPFVFAVRGEGTEPVPPPEISVDYNGTDIPDGDAAPSAAKGTDFGSVDFTGGSVTRTYRVLNTGGETLELGSASSSDGDFLVSGLAASVAPGSSDEFTVTFDPNSAGTKTATISFPTNDADENAFDFEVTGVGTEPVLPAEISVDYSGTDIPDDDATPSTAKGTDFGRVDFTGGSVTRTYRVRNTGGEILNLGSLSSSDADFLVSGLVASVFPGSSDEFTVTFDPTSPGTKTATISFVTNDADENPFDFAVRGVGVEPSGPSWARPSGWIWTQGEWEWSVRGRYWYWIPSGPPFVRNTSTGQVVARPVNGWNFYNWPYFWNSSRGVWYYIFQGNLPYVRNPQTGQWRRWGE